MYAENLRESQISGYGFSTKCRRNEVFAPLKHLEIFSGVSNYRMQYLSLTGALKCLSLF